jgi:amino acid transporter
MLSQQGQAPRFFSKILPNGVPIYALGFTSLFSLLAFLNVSAGATTAFNWLANITTLGSQISWINIAIANIRFNRALKVQGVSRAVLPFRCPVSLPEGFAALRFRARLTLFLRSRPSCLTR